MDLLLYDAEKIDVDPPLDCGTPTTHRLYPFGAEKIDNHYVQNKESTYN